MAAPPDQFLAINPRVWIPLAELNFSFSRSSGPGGQNVNKVSTRVTLTFDVRSSKALSAAQKARVLDRLHTRIDSSGVLRVSASRHRTQAANRRTVLARFVELLADAFTPRTPRVATRVPAGAVARRLREKTHRSERKRQRQSQAATDE